MFIGEYTHAIDEKGRLSIPAKFRRSLVGTVVLTRGLDHCLFLYPQAQWEALAQKLAALPITHAKARAFARLMLAGAWDATLDTQGRVVLPEYLRTYAGITKPVVVAGLYNRLEIWALSTWHEYRKASERDSNDIASSLGEIGI